MIIRGLKKEDDFERSFMMIRALLQRKLDILEDL
jgi:hypothetical protein